MVKQLVWSALLLTFAAGSIYGQEIYLSSLDNRLYRFNLAGCTYEQIGSVPGGSTDIAFHPNGNLYAVSTTGRLTLVNPATGGGTLVHAFEASASQLYTSLTASAEGIFYTCGLDGDLWSYNLATGVGAFLGNTGYPAEGDLTFYEGQLYMAASGDNIVRVDINNPAASTVVINGEIAGRIFGIVSYAATCESITTYALTSNPARLFEIDFDAQTLAPYCSLPFTVSGGASTYEFLGSNPVLLDEISVADFSCTAATGSIGVTASGGVGSLSYSLDGQQYQASPQFSGLPVGVYTVFVQDEAGCRVEREIDLGLALPQPAGVTVTPANCGQPNGSISLSASGGTPPYSLSIDGGTPQSGLMLSGLAPGFYALVLSDAAGCQTPLSANVGGINAPSFVSLQAQPTRCGQPNGSISALGQGGVAPLSYALAGGQPQAEGNFSALPAGSYPVRLIDAAGCEISANVEIAPSDGVALRAVEATDTRCGQNNGQLLLTAEGGAPPLLYSAEGVNFSPEAGFDNLPAGNYRPVARDANGCESSMEALIGASSAPRLGEVQLTPSDCDAPTGAIGFIVDGGVGPWRVTLNGREAASPATALPAGDYVLIAADALACADTVELRLARRLCPIYLPNAFSPNDDGVNDYFAPQSVDGLAARIRQFLVFDRWGGLVFRAEDVAFGDAAARWDGRRRGAGALPAPLDPGVFAYVLELVYPDGEVQQLAGEVLMVR